ncbi:MAG: type I-E CRISPR-associated protein Cas6/Cse3/CasE [Ezakiella massiliensis]
MASRDEEVFVRHDEDKAKAANLKLVSATYEGILTITDLDKFKNALVSGIGKKKAYGFGFLTIIPIK